MRYERDKPDKFGFINVKGVVSIIKYSDGPKTILLCMKHLVPIHTFYYFRFYRSLNFVPIVSFQYGLTSNSVIAKESPSRGREGDEAAAL